jgi:acetoin utilization protein AcuB
MCRNPVYIHPDLSLSDARSLMDKEKIGHLPVLNKANELVGLVTRADLLKAGPSPATSLDVYEISYLLSKLTVEKTMVKNVVTVSENEVVEEAARIMADKGIGCLPVMNGHLLAGIITDTDLFHVFIDTLGARHPGVRITLNFSEKPGQLGKFATLIGEKGGNIVAFASFEGDDLSHKRATFKIEGLSLEDVRSMAKAIEGAETEDIR